MILTVFQVVLYPGYISNFSCFNSKNCNICNLSTKRKSIDSGPQLTPVADITFPMHSSVQFNDIKRNIDLFSWDLENTNKGS